MCNFNQHNLIIKINQYLQYKNRPLKLTSGYCHGITLLWLYKISVGQESWFYDITKKIAACRDEKNYDDIEWDIELFISYIEWLQNSNYYLRGVNQLDIDKLTELPREFSLSFLFHHSQLNDILKMILKPDKLILMSGPNHTIGIYVKDNNVYVLDPKYNQIQPKIINDITKLKLELIKCLFNRDYLPNCRLPLEIMILSNPDQSLGNQSCQSEYGDLTTLYSQLIQCCNDIDKPGLDGITNIHLACESGNEQEVCQLLEAGAEPNQMVNNEWSPMHIAALRGDVSIVKLLLRYGANAYISNRNGLKPVDMAAEAGHEEIMKLL